MNDFAFKPDFARLFDSAPGIYLVLLPDTPKFTMIAANQARLQATKTTHDQIIGKGLFDLFPDNPDDPNATGTRNLRLSLDRVIETLQPQTMAVQKYDIPKPKAEGGGFEERYWSPMNIPVLDDNRKLVYIIHRVEDVTEFIKLKQQGTEQTKLTGELRAKVEKTESEVFARAQEVQESNRMLQEAHSKLEKLFAENKALDKIKTDFFANVSHEFRTPLTLILGPMDDLLSGVHGSLSENQRKPIEVIHRNALRLLKLVNNLLDFSRLESGRGKAFFERFDLSATTAALANAFQSTFDKAGIRLKVCCPPVTEPVYLDREMWEKIVLNLVSNAFKFTFNGEIEVTLHSVGGAVELMVRDTGIGIPEHELPRIFERFHRVDGAGGRSHEGTGIGLSLVQELIKLHGGTITVESELGKGSVFKVTIPSGNKHLPADQLSGALNMVTSTATRSEAFIQEARGFDLSSNDQHRNLKDAESRAKKCIVVADDNADMRAYVTQLLAQSHEVIAVGDGRQALNAIIAHHPDLVVSDVMMPVMNGIELLKTLRSDPQFQTLPVILLSARAGEESTVSGIELGADDYVTKPFSAKELQARVQTQLNLLDSRTRLLKQLEFSNQELDAFCRSVSHDLRAPLRGITGFSQILLDDYSSNVSEEVRRYLQRISTAAEKMGQLIDGLLNLSRISRGELLKEHVDLSTIVETIASDLTAANPNLRVDLTVPPGLNAKGDRRLLEIALQNLLSNAWKFTSKKSAPKIEFGEKPDKDGTFFVRDNGAGFDMKYVDKLFGVFQRLHVESDFEGTGIGLATVRRIIERHGGRIWAESEVSQGSTFYFTL